MITILNDMMANAQRKPRHRDWNAPNHWLDPSRGPISDRKASEDELRIKREVLYSTGLR